MLLFIKLGRLVFFMILCHSCLTFIIQLIFSHFFSPTFLVFKENLFDKYNISCFTAVNLISVLRESHLCTTQFKPILNDEDENRDIEQEYNSRSISLLIKNIDTTTFISHKIMETAGVEPASRGPNT